MNQNQLGPPGEKTYLGDGAYATFDGFNVWVTAENGIEVTNQVCLEPAVLARFKQFLKEQKL